MDFGDMDQDDFEDINEMDQMAINRCKGLRRQPVLIEDMQPENAVHLEYSYRPMDIDQFWAGPAPWKFRQSRQRASLGAVRMSRLNVSVNKAGAPGERPKIVRRRNPKKSEAVINELYTFEEIMPGEVLKGLVKAKTTLLTNQMIAKKWDTKKHKLPVDYKVPLEMYNKFLFASAIHIDSNKDVTFAGGDDDDAITYDYNNENDRDYCRGLDDQSDTETATTADVGPMDNVDFDNLEAHAEPPPVDEIPDIFVGAPERIEKISIAFAKRAKIIDMKQLKSCSWNLIKQKHNVEPERDPKFSETPRGKPLIGIFGIIGTPWWNCSYKNGIKIGINGIVGTNFD